MGNKHGLLGKFGDMDSRMMLWIILLIILVLVIALFFGLSSGVLNDVFLKVLI